LRCSTGFITVIAGLKISGKRGVRQLSIFELVIILTLGSAAGDIAFYKEVGVLHAVITILFTVLLYRFITYLLPKSRKLTKILEGEPVTIIKNGIYTGKIQSYENLSHDEFYMELRGKGIEHLGQIKIAVLEVNGDVSIFKNASKQTQPGLCILPEAVENIYTNIPEDGLYACIHCGNTANKLAHTAANCKHCGKNEWGITCDNSSEE